MPAASEVKDSLGPAGEPEEILLGLLSSLLDDLHLVPSGPVTLDSNFMTDLGLDSLGLVELHDRVQQAFGVPLPEDVFTATTPAGWLRGVARSRPAPSRSRTRRVGSAAVRPSGGAWPERPRTQRGLRLARRSAP